MEHLKNYSYENGIYRLILENDENNTTRIVICNDALLFMCDNMPYIALKTENKELFLYKYNKFCDPTDSKEKVLLYELTESMYKKIFKEFEKNAVNYPNFKEFVSKEVMETKPEVKKWEENINEKEIIDESNGTDIVDEIIEHKKTPLKISKASTIIIDVILFILIGIGMVFLFKITNNQNDKNNKTNIISTENKTESNEILENTVEKDNEESINNIIIQEGNTIKYEGDITAYDVSLVVDEAMPSIVSILSQTDEEAAFDKIYEQKIGNAGSGIIVGKNETELLIATNYHLLSDSDIIEVTFSQDKEEKYPVIAQIKGSDENNDLAILSIKIKDINEEIISNIKIAVIGDSKKLKLGEPVIAIGNACGYGPSVTAGVVSATDRKIGEEGPYIQTDAAINPGNSGGALINKDGEVIGINCAKLASEDIEGIGYAIPSSTFTPIVNDLSKLETREKVKEEDRGYLGILGTDVTVEANIKYDMPLGAFVSEIMDGGAASKSLLQEKDIITKVNDKNISNMKQLQNELCYYKKNDVITLTIKRFVVDRYEDINITVKLQSQVK